MDRIRTIKALLYFHLRVGVRIAIRASAPLFCGIVAVIMFQDPPAASIVALARSAFASRWSPANVIPIAAIAFVLPAWGTVRLSEGMSGWIRHLPLSDAAHRAGLVLALASVQVPLMVMLALLARTAAQAGLQVGAATLQWILVLFAGVIASLPVTRRFLTVPLAGVAAGVALFGANHYAVLVPLLLLIAMMFAGPIKLSRGLRRWRSSGVLVNWRITSRAVGRRIVPALVSGFLAIAAGWLFIVNNQLSGSTSAAAARLAGSMACTFCLFSISRALAERRPAWPLARSFPWSAMRRVADDSLFLAAHALPLVLFVVSQNVFSALLVLLTLPYLSVRAAEYVRRIPEHRVAAFAFLGEGAVVSIVLTLLPWSAVLWSIGTIGALLSARRAERDQRSTDWFELHHATAGDTSSWNP